MATTPNYTVDYEDERFQQVETDKNLAINEMNNTYDQMIGQTDQYYQDQIKASQDYAQQQQDLQNQNTQFAIDTINQQKAQAEKDYTKEQSGAYVDWQKQSNQYGANAEQMATNGLTNTGYSESSQVSMYNQYQSRVATARESFSKAVLNYDNSIKEAQLANNSALAEIAYKALQTQLELSLQGFQYKNNLLLEQLNAKQQLENTYYSRYQDVLGQINSENAMAEQVRQYNESLAEEKRQFTQNYNLQKEQFAEQKRQYEKDYTMKEKQYKEEIRQFDTQIAYYKEKDKQQYALEIKKLEEQKRQAKQEQANWEKEYKLTVKKMEQAQKQWEKEYALSQAKAYSSGGSGGSASISKSSSSSINKSNSKNTSGVLGAVLGGLASTSKSSGGSNNALGSQYNKALQMTRTIYNTARANKRQSAESMLATYVAKGTLTQEGANKILKNLGIK